MPAETDLGTLLRSAFHADGETRRKIASPPTVLKPGQRRNAAVLFLDLEGFTALSGVIDHETLHDVTGSIMDQLVISAEEYSGYVDKIEGDRIMVVFGALQSGENDSSRAVHCGFRMLEVLDLAGSVLASSGVNLSARIGISSGPVTVAPDSIGHLTAMGNTVNMASRMEEQAATNTMLVTDTVHSLCRDCAVWEEPRKVSVKGVDSPVTVWTPVAALRPGGSSGDGSPFVGRKSEYRALLSALGSSSGASAPDGLPRHTLIEITGDAGTGKARLAGEFLREECPDMLVLRGRSIPHGQPAHWLWSSVICYLLGFNVQKAVSWEEFVSRLSSVADPAELESALPFIGKLIPSHTDDHRFTTLGMQALALEMKLAIRDLIENLARNRRVAILLENDHWIDTTDLKVLKFILENCRTTSPLLFILTGRDAGEEVPAAALRKSSFYYDYHGVHLDDLSREEAGELAGAMAGFLTGQEGHVFSEQTLDMLWSHSSGNPFFLRELVTHLIESEGLKLISGVWRISGPSIHQSRPESLSGLLQSRLDNLPEEWRSTLLLCSVLGREFLYETYRMVSARLGAEISSEDTFDSLVERQMLTRADSGGMKGFRFRHSLIQRSAYENNLSHNLKLIHRAAAEAMEELFSREDGLIAARLATHWEGAGDLGSAAEWGLLAQKHASENYQHAVSLQWGEKLLNWLEKGSEKYMKVLERNASAYLYTGRTGEHLKALESIIDIATENDNREWMARGHMNLGAQCRASGQYDRALEHLNRAYELCSENGLRELEANTLGNMGVLAADQRDADMAMEYFGKARKIHSEMGNSKGEANTLGNLGIMLRNLQKPKEAIEHLSQALDLFREMGDVRNEAITMGNIGNIYHDLKEFEKAESQYEEALRIFTRIGDRRSGGIFTGNLGILNYDMKNDEKAEEYFNKALSISIETENPRSRGWTLSNICLLRLRHGEIRKASECCCEALELFRKIGDRRMEVVSLAAAGYVAFLEGDLNRSEELYNETVGMVSAMKLPPRDFQETLIPHREKLVESTGREFPLPDHWNRGQPSAGS